MRLLIVEDEFLIATTVAATLTDAGCQIVGMASSVAKALKLLETTPCDAAVLDANLDGSSAEEFAVALNARAIPFLVLSGYSDDQRTDALAGAPFLSKPCSASDLVAAVMALRR